MSKDLPNNPEAGPSPERRLIDAAFEQELGSPTGPTPSPPSFGEAGSLLGSPEDIPGYQIVREIHRGGQGVVYQAIQKATKRTVAIKVIREGPFAGAADKARFEREVQILATLNHPNIVTIHDSGEARGSFYYVMTYVPGESLDVYLTHSARTPEEALRLFVQICAAVNAAHLQGVIHRDLKPGNICVDPTGEPHILDFGLARRSPGTSTGDSAPPAMTLTGQFVGSLPWASPEQAEGVPGKIDIRTDVYSLGVILYQMLTGRFPYAVVGNMRDVLDNILKAEPAKPSTIRRQINDEVETIVLKCLSKERERRYQTAGELARDISHYLNREPIEAKRDSALYMLKKSLRRYQLPLAFAAVFAVFVTGSALALLLMYQKQGELLAQRDHQERATRKENLVQKLRAECNSPRREDWSVRAWKHAAEIAALGRDEAARDLATVSLVDVDAHQDRLFSDLGASDFAFDRNGGQLLVGGLDDQQGSPVQDAKLLDLRTGTRSGSGLPGAGPVAFRPDGTPLQLVAKEDRLQLWNVATRTRLHELRFSGPLAPPRPGRPAIRAPALSADGSFAAAATSLPDGKRTVAVWDCGSGQRIHNLDGDAEALAFTPDGGLLAAGDASGQITVWSLAEEKPIAAPRAEGTAVRCLRFGRDPVLPRAIAQQTDGQRWLLAAGYAGGAIVVWNLAKGQPLAFCRGSPFDVNAVDFSPDGMLLASCGRYEVRLWDVCSGQLVLRLTREVAPFQSAVRFSPDGGLLALGTPGTWSPARVCLWKLENGRGIRALRGLTAQVEMSCFSRDGRLVAALSHEWKVAIWDLQAQGRLLHVLNVPRGYTPDNAALAFSRDGRWLAFSTGNTACLWDVDSGHLRKEWSLGEGLNDRLTFNEKQELLSFRTETCDFSVAPMSDAPPKDYPRICRLRRIAPVPGPTRPGVHAADTQVAEPAVALVKEINDFDVGVNGVTAAPDGSYFAVLGRGSVTPGQQRRMIKVFDANGCEMPNVPSTLPAGKGGAVSCDPTGGFLTLNLGEEPGSTLYAMPTFQRVGLLGGGMYCLSPRAQYWAGPCVTTEDDRSLGLFET